MGIAKVVTLSVRPSQATHLCFEVGGILGVLNAELGATVTAFDFAGFYAILGSTPTIAGHPARLLYDFLEIQSSANPFTLASLRAEPGKAALHKAINARANAYYAKYGNASAIITRMTNSYSPTVTGSKPNRLDILSSLSLDQMQKLNLAYLADSRTDVVRTTDSVLNSVVRSSGTTTTTGWTDNVGVSDAVAAGTISAPPTSGLSGVTVSGSNPVNEDVQMGASEQDSRSSGTASESQTIHNTDYGYRIPYLENLAQFERAQISLIDESFSQFMAGQALPYLAAVFENELNSIDSDVFQLQIAYLNTILMSPISGIVTGIYKNPGDVVRAGDPVIRIENSAEILLVSKLKYRGAITIGSTATVTTSLYDIAGPPTTITGSVVAARGVGEDDEWEVIVKCNNLDGGGNPIFPFGYHFDYDDTTVSIS